jgi:transposase
MLFDIRRLTIGQPKCGPELVDLTKRSCSPAFKWLEYWQENGSTSPKPTGGSVSPVELHAGWLLELIRQQSKVLEARCRAPSTAQREVKRARIVMLAAEGRSTRSIAEELGFHPRAVALCRAWPWWAEGSDHGLARNRSTARIRTSAFWRFWISRLLRVMPGGWVRCWPRPWATLMFSMSGASCASTNSILPPANPGARATTASFSWPSRRRGVALCRSARQGDRSLC